MSLQLVDEQLIERIQKLAKSRQLKPDEVIAESLTLYEERFGQEKSDGEKGQPDSSDFWSSIAGIGASGQPDIAERAEEILAEEIDPIDGASTHVHA